MANTKCFTSTTNLKFKTEMAVFRRLGHEDFRNGLGFRREYETWPEKHQRAYENGRAVAANVQSARLPLPVWKFGEVRPRGFVETAAQAASLVGGGLLQVGAQR